jgi:hypothetical protein
MAEPVRPATGAAPGQDPNLIYALGSSPGGSARLQRHVAGLGADPAHTAMSARFAARRGLGDVEIITADAAAPDWRPAPSTWCTHTKNDRCSRAASGRAGCAETGESR